MEKVYLVYYDNGQKWEDHYVKVSKVFASMLNANAYAEERNARFKEFTPSVTKEKYESENWAEQNGYTYEEYIDSERYDWYMINNARYYVKEEIVHP